MSIPKIFSKLFKNSGVGPDLNEEIVTTAVETLLNGTGQTDVVTRSYLNIANVYVNATNGNDSNDGLTAATAFKTINAAMTKVRHMGEKTVINIAAGTYTENVYITSDRFKFWISGNVVLNGAILVRRGAYLEIDDGTSTTSYTFTAQYLLVQDLSFFISFVKMILSSNNSLLVQCVRNSDIQIIGGLELNKTSAGGSAIQCQSASSILVASGPIVANGNNTAGACIDILGSSIVYFHLCDVSITNFTTFAISSALSSVFLMDGNGSNTFTMSTSCSTSVNVRSGAGILFNGMSGSITNNCTNTSESNGKLILNIYDNSWVRMDNSNLTLNIENGNGTSFIRSCVGSSYTHNSGTLTLNGIINNANGYAGTVCAYANGSIFLQKNLTLNGNTTGGKRFYAFDCGFVGIQGHSAGANRIPGTIAGVADSASYGYYG